MPRKRGDDFESTFIATRRRLQSLGTVIVPAPTTIPPHTHHAIEIISEPEPVTALLDGVNVQEVEEELGYEKLARSGEQPWLGPDPLDMNHFSIDNADDLEVEGTATVREDVVLTGIAGLAKVTGAREVTFVPGAVAEATVNNVRVAHFVGDHVEDEAKIDGLERVVFNAEPTASSIEQPSRMDLNIGVEAGVDYTAAEGRVSWDTLEDVLVAYVASGAGVVAVALGWGAVIAANGLNPA